MNEEYLATWVQKLGRAWEDRNPQAAAALFSADVVYSENPFAPALHGRAAVAEYWRSETAGHANVQCAFEVIGVAGSSGIAHWHTTLARSESGAQVALDGVIVVEFNSAGECCSLREWWHSQEA
jgi:hypothetical protein